MQWYWKIRIHKPEGGYAVTQVATERGNTREIDAIKDFYEAMTGCKLLLEGMSEIPYSVTPLAKAFDCLWVPR